MRLKPHLLVNLVAVALLGVLLVGWVVTQIVSGGVFEQPMTVTADFASSGGVFTNQEVTYRGVLVGKVGDLTLNEGGVDIELLIDSEWEGEIPANVTAEVKSKSAVGEQFVNLTPPEVAADESLEDGDEIARASTRLPVDFQELLQSLDKVLLDIGPQRTRRLIENLADGLGGRSEDIADILESLGTLSEAFADTVPQQQRLLRNSTIAGREFLRTKEEFADAIRAADEVVAGIGDEPEELEALLETNDRLAREATELLQRRSDDFAGGIRALSNFLSFQRRNSDELIIKSLEYVPAFLHAVEDASVPWRSPDGREFYRIRIGLIFDNVQSTWPCKFRLPEGYERYPHERGPRSPITGARCRRAPSTEGANELRAALKQWAKETAEITPEEVPLPFGEFKPIREEKFVWPLVGELLSGFGPRGGAMHTGLDIKGESGDPVVAARSGSVILSGTYFGYGTTVIIDHGDGVSSLYGHLSEAALKQGDRIGRGELVGSVGCTGDCDGDHLHFEIRIDEKPVAPMPYLPKKAEPAPSEPEPRPSPGPTTRPRPYTRSVG